MEYIYIQRFGLMFKFEGHLVLYSLLDKKSNFHKTFLEFYLVSVSYLVV